MEPVSPPAADLHLLKKVRPLMAPEERRTLWRKVQAVWKQPTAEAIAEITRSRHEWDA